MDYVSLVMLAIQEAPAVGKLIAGYINAGKQPSQADVAADIAALGLSDDDLKAAYQRAFGVLPPT